MTDPARLDGDGDGLAAALVILAGRCTSEADSNVMIQASRALRAQPTRDVAEGAEDGWRKDINLIRTTLDRAVMATQSHLVPSQVTHALHRIEAALCNSSATPQPAPDAVRPDDGTYDEGITYAIAQLASLTGATDWQIRDGSESVEGDVRATILDVLKNADIYDEEDGRFSTFSAPVPPADGAGVLLITRNAARLGMADPVAAIVRQASIDALFNGAGTVINPEVFDDASIAIRTALSPSGTGAAEPVAHYHQSSTMHMGDCSVCGNVSDHPLHIGSPSFATPPVRGDREAIVSPVERVEMVGYSQGYELETDPAWRITIGNVCADFATEEWANNFRNAILSLHIQPGTGEREAWKEIGEAWAKLEAAGFPPEASGWPFQSIEGELPHAIDAALDCLIRQREDLLKEVVELRKTRQPPQSSREG